MEKKEKTKRSWDTPEMARQKRKAYLEEAGKPPKEGKTKMTCQFLSPVTKGAKEALKKKKCDCIICQLDHWLNHWRLDVSMKKVNTVREFIDFIYLQTDLPSLPHKT